jgi:2-oxoglutarate ferredoxin oxidoreductase subunit delta
MASVIFDEELCKGCELCTIVCPKKIIKMMQDHLNSKGFKPATVIEMYKCTGCAFCATICPDVVISVEK